MLKEKLMLSLLLICFGIMTSCNQDKVVETSVVELEKKQQQYEEPHPYGGWFCPDNLGGFPPVDIQKLDEVPVVKFRLPTRAETQDGTSLMYFDPEKYPEARPLNIKVPQVARHYSKHSDINELVIIIQAAVIGQDTVVGFRYPSGGNGTAWYSEVDFLSNKEVEEIGDAPFVFLETEIKASKGNIWKAITKTDYAKKLGEKFDQKEFFESEWSDDERAHLNYENDKGKASGVVLNMWGNMYIHVDYDHGGFHFAEKVLLFENQEENTAKLHIVAGPFPEDIVIQKSIWEKWLKEVKIMSEGL